uniref:Uncharacterized protein n=1 Tax=Molossus molossus TaxID=27622 RepID=A0A7J8BMD4_MOLMO|nr:hypothetical protein HJG59_010139 [Molossus molossus]
MIKSVSPPKRVTWPSPCPVQWMDAAVPEVRCLYLPGTHDHWKVNTERNVSIVHETKMPHPDPDGKQFRGCSPLAASEPSVRAAASLSGGPQWIPHGALPRLAGGLLLMWELFSSTSWLIGVLDATS